MSIRTMKTVRVAAIGCLVLLDGAMAMAEPSAASPTTEDRAALATRRARLTYREGVDAFNRKDFESARIAFLQTLALKPDVPEVRRNLGLAQIYSGHYLEGARRVARVLHSDNAGSAQDRTRMLESLKKAESHLERLTIEVDIDDATIEVDGVVLGESPLPFVWYVSPGNYSVRVSKAGYLARSQNRASKAGAVSHIRVQLPLKRVRPSVPAFRQPLGPPPAVVAAEQAETAAWIVGGVATATGLVAGGVLTRMALDSKKDLNGWRARVDGDNDSLCAMDDPLITEYCEEGAAYETDYEVARSLSIASISFAGLAAVSTLVYIYWPWDNDPPVQAKEKAKAFEITDVGVAWTERNLGFQVSASF